MSHMKLLESPAIQVDTCHGPVFLSIGQNSHGHLRVVVVGPGDERTDLHLTDVQARYLAVALDDQARRIDKAHRPHMYEERAS
ncbi:hypothetical protein [Gordonia alkanivorans]|uniref:hypothetical protein n=1 Tax=Gordonia alkanivorans TaxID=84096 RepID=UPI0024B831EB|nr:hypothetical protein [Gordonia alkanivorans]MDJ0010137.1 hypothetical protein [Gordonia alkanivorans]MDJ0495673.1 hypothetical protein [Gordonia alkanivorans]